MRPFLKMASLWILLLALLPLGCGTSDRIYTGAENETIPPESDAGFEVASRDEPAAELLGGDDSFGVDTLSDAGFEIDSRDEPAADLSGGEDSPSVDSLPEEGGDPTPQPKPECRTAGDCQLQDDCCQCLGIYPLEKVPICSTKVCVWFMCNNYSIPQGVQCRAGRCVAGIDCDRSKVTCRTPEPACAAGEVISVKGQCYGPCIVASECLFVPSCAACNPNTQVCVRNESFVPDNHCVDLPAACAGNITCACLGTSVCTEPFTLCQDGPSGEKSIRCLCPNC